MDTGEEPNGSTIGRRGRPAGRRPASTLSMVLLSILLVVFIAGGIFSGCLFLSTMGNLFVASAPEVPITVPFVPQPTPQQPTPQPEQAAWHGTDRVTFLLLGLDQREDERGRPTRSDTMILVTVDPATKRAGMLSIPRDLWVPIPGHDENKINTAHFFGEMDKPGEGPALAKKTVEYNFGVRIHYVARVDFRGFEKLIDALGGITVDVERPIRDDEYPSEDYGIQRIYIPAGIQRMDGITALRYARSRHADNDFARSLRQQAVLLAARDEALQPSVLPKLPLMIGILNEAISTDVPAKDYLPLLNLVRSVNRSDVVSRSIDYTMVVDVNGDGTILQPDRDKIRAVIQDLFTSSPPTPTPAPTATPAPEPSRTIPVKVQVLNGTIRDRFGATTAEALKALGYLVTNVAQASRSDYAETVVLDHTGRGQDAARLAALLGVPAKAVKRQSGEGSADITVILGLDANPPVAP